MAIVRWKRHAVLGRRPRPQPLAALAPRALRTPPRSRPGSTSSTRRRNIVREVVADVDEQAAERRRDARVRRHEDRRDRRAPCASAAPCSAPGAAEDDERELARVVAAADRDQPHRVGHVRVGDVDDRAARRRSVSRPSGSPTPFAIACLGRAGVERRSRRRRARRRGARARRWRRCWSAPRRRARSRPGRGRRRPTAGRCAASRPSSIQASEPPPAPIVRISMLGKQIGWPYSTAHSLVVRISPLVDERDVGARAAHVEPDGVLEAAQRRDVAAGDRARGDARGGEAHRRTSAPARRS